MKYQRHIDIEHYTSNEHMSR